MEYKRSFRRSEVRMLCPCRTLDGVPLEIELLDLSEGGCAARSLGIELHVGQSVRLFPEGCEAFTATVRRSSASLAGLEFDRPLSPPVFERIRAYAPAPAASEDGPEPSGIANAQPDTPALACSEDPFAKDNAARGQPFGSLLSLGKKPGTKKMAIS